MHIEIPQGKSRWTIVKNGPKITVTGKHDVLERFGMGAEDVRTITREFPRTFLSIQEAIAHYRASDRRVGGYGVLIENLERVAAAEVANV